MATLDERLRERAHLLGDHRVEPVVDDPLLIEAAEALRVAGRLLNEWSGSGERELPRMYRETHAFLMGNNADSKSLPQEDGRG